MLLHRRVSNFMKAVKGEVGKFYNWLISKQSIGRENKQLSLFWEGQQTPTILVMGQVIGVFVI